MSRLVHCAVLLLVLHSAVSATISVVSIPGNEICLPQEKGGVHAAIQSSIRAAIHNVIVETTSKIVASLNCGSGLWYHVAHLNMSNPAQQCPPPWRELENNGTNGVRTCGRPPFTSGSCLPIFYRTDREYSRVCGRVIGYQYGSTEAFDNWAVGTIDSYYVYGVSITHGVPRNHIWTLAAGETEGGYTTDPGWNCPCSNPGRSGNVLPPSFVGDNYYCESGNPGTWYTFNHLFSADPLWDGQQCEGQCCSDGKSPPWFSVELQNPTTDDIEVRICVPQPTYDDVMIQLLELYVQ